MKPIIRAAVDSGRPPLELLLDQPNRERCKWDGILIKALYLLESYELEGYPIWVEESPNITFTAKRRKIRSVAVVEAAQDAAKNSKEKGVRWYAEANLKAGASWPTRKDWLARRMNKTTAVEEGDNSQRIAEAEERARKKVEGDPELERIVAEFKEKFNKSTDKMD